ncbi:MAG: helix-turn-helix transcriptional regulator [Oscillospiraceae bacterium]|nr:helix-turn-helix transcriptional regulator [Oscillospiraceae bacterium]
MISYNRFWDTMRQAGESTYTLTKHHRISNSTIDKLRKDKPITTTTINDLCRILNCRVEEIMEYIPSEEDQKL